MTTAVAITSNATEMKIKNLNPCGCLHGGTCVIIDHYCICRAGYTGARCGDFVLDFSHKANAKSSTGGMIAGLVSGGIFVLAVIVFIVFIWRRCRTLKKKRHSQRMRESVQSKFTLEGYSTHSYKDKTLFHHNRKEDFESQDKDAGIQSLEEISGISSASKNTKIDYNDSQSLEKKMMSSETGYVHIINENVKNETNNVETCPIHHKDNTLLSCQEDHNLKLSDKDQIEITVKRKTRRNAVSHRPIKNTTLSETTQR